MTDELEIDENVEEGVNLKFKYYTDVTNEEELTNIASVTVRLFSQLPPYRLAIVAERIGSCLIMDIDRESIGHIQEVPCEETESYIQINTEIDGEE